ncbi:hypothetical protein L911_0263 [Vibrio fluvialis I21563]|nr:hypothetical protein L911_0263 [Vibrio fluvialis I21563]
MLTNFRESTQEAQREKAKKQRSPQAPSHRCFEKWQAVYAKSENSGQY